MLGAAAEAGVVLDATIAANAEQARGLWRIREGIAEVQKHEGASIKHDVSLPPVPGRRLRGRGHGGG